MIKYQVVGNTEEDSSVTVFLDGRQYIMNCDHASYREVVSALVMGTADESIIDMFDIGKAIGRKFSAITDRVSVDDHAVYFDGDEVHGAIADQILRFLNEGVDDYWPLVMFMENVAANPEEHSRTQLYDWLNCHDLTITEDGYFVAYKGVVKKDDGSLCSVNRGVAFVDGQEYTGQIPNHFGAVVTMPRSQVMHDPSVGCAAGLHVGTYQYASQWNKGAMLEVWVDPRDVVSVPSEAHGEKVRVCRYTVVKELDAPYQTAIRYNQMDEEWDDDYEDGPDYGDDYDPAEWNRSW